MTWGGIGYIGRTPIAFLDGNQDSQCYQRTLERSLLPYLDQIVDGDAVFQQDNCPIHTSCQYNLYESKNVTVERKILVTLQLQPHQRSSLLRPPQRSRNLSLKDPL